MIAAEAATGCGTGASDGTTAGGAVTTGTLATSKTGAGALSKRGIGAPAGAGASTFGTGPTTAGVGGLTSSAAAVGGGRLLPATCTHFCSGAPGFITSGSRSTSTGPIRFPTRRSGRSATSVGAVRGASAEKPGAEVRAGAGATGTCAGRAKGRLVSGFVQPGIAFGLSCCFISLCYRSCRSVDLRSRYSRQWSTPPSLSGFSLGADDHADALCRTTPLYSAGYAQVCTACARRNARISTGAGS